MPYIYLLYILFSLHVERVHPFLNPYTLFLPLDFTSTIWGLNRRPKESAKISTPETGEGVDGRTVERSTPWVSCLTLLLTLIVSVYRD